MNLNEGNIESIKDSENKTCSLLLVFGVDFFAKHFGECFILGVVFSCGFSVLSVSFFVLSVLFVVVSVVVSVVVIVVSVVTFVLFVMIL